MSANDPDDFLSEIKKYMEEARRKERPDYRNAVYCDKHLGVKMLLSRSWGSVEWRSLETDDPWADANPNLIWFCPKPDCDRHYEPTMFGYHINEQGRRLDGRWQPRGNHAGRPFMYIAKVGQGRQYKCPLYKCDEIGAVVAQSVVDEDVQLPPDPLANLKGDERKSALEMLVFLRFAAASGLPIDEGSASNGPQYHPDILCTISGQKYWFELGRIVNEDVAKKLSDRRNPGGFSFDQGKPFVYMVNEKATKRYQTQGAPVDLILHFDLRFGSASTAQWMCEKDEPLLKSLITTGPFKRVWVFDEINKNVIWHS